MVLVSIVIPTFNRKEMLKRLLLSLQHSTWREYEVIVVDDASSDGTGEMLRREFPDIRYVRHERETLVAQSRNDGILESKGKYVFFVDDDNVVAPDTIEKLVEVMEADPKIGTAAPVTCFMDKPNTVMTLGANFSRIMRRTLFPYEGVNVSELEGKLVDIMIGGNSFMLRREAAIKAGLIPADRIPWDMEDGYLIYKMRVKLGYRAVVVGSAKVYQYHGPIRGVKRFNEMRLYYHMRSKIVLHKDLDPWPAKITFYLFSPIYLAYFSYLGLRSKAKLKGMLRVWQGYFDGMLGRFNLKRIPSNSWAPSLPALKTENPSHNKAIQQAEPQQQVKTKNYLPTVTVAIAAHESGPIIGECLRSVRNQNYPQDKYDIIVVDDSNDQETRRLCSVYGARYIYAPTTDSPGKARNVALDNCDSDIIAFIDTDCVAPNDWLTKIVEDLHQEEDDVAGVAGAYEGGKNWLQRLVNKEHIHNTKLKCFSTGFLEGNCALRHSLLNGKRFGENKYGEGIVLANQLTKANLKIITDYDLRVTHNGFTHTLTKFFQMGRAHYNNTNQYLDKKLRTNTVAIGTVASLLLLGAASINPLFTLPTILLSGGFAYYAYKWHKPVPLRLAIPAYIYFIVARWIFWLGYTAELITRKNH